MHTSFQLFSLQPLSRLGANVVGLDASEENVETARYHQTPDLSNLTYAHSSLEDFAESEEGLFDGVVLSEVVEHVNNLPHFMHLACSLVKVSFFPSKPHPYSSHHTYLLGKLKLHISSSLNQFMNCSESQIHPSVT